MQKQIEAGTRRCGDLIPTIPYRTPAAGNGSDPTASLHVQTIEKTGKKWKGLTVLGEVACVLGIALIVLRLPNLPIKTFDPVANLGCLLLGAGFVAACYCEVMAWWHHG